MAKRTRLPFYKINQYITASEIRLIDEKAKQIGIVSLSEALGKAHAAGLDLVEIAPNAKPPVVKLISFSKFKYQEAKKIKAERKGHQKGGLKEIQAQPFIGQGDYQTKLKRAKKFLNTGNKVKLSIKFLGRQIMHQEFGYDLVKKFTKDLIPMAVPEGETRLMGKRLITTFTAVKKTNEKNQQKI